MLGGGAWSVLGDGPGSAVGGETVPTVINVSMIGRVAIETATSITSSTTPRHPGDAVVRRLTPSSGG